MPSFLVAMLTTAKVGMTTAVSRRLYLSRLAKLFVDGLGFWNWTLHSNHSSLAAGESATDLTAGSEVIAKSKDRLGSSAAAAVDLGLARLATGPALTAKAPARVKHSLL